MPAFFRLALTTVAVKSLLPNFPHNPLAETQLSIQISSRPARESKAQVGSRSDAGTPQKIRGSLIQDIQLQH